MPRVFNFSPGPAMLPAAVIEKVQAELSDWKKCGMSVMEISHRSPAFLNIVEQSKAMLRKLLNIPDNYCILFLHGGASMQCSAIPLNLSSPKKNADYIITGQWGLKAYNEAKRFSKTRIISNTMEQFSTPNTSELAFNDDAAYLHYTDNETILGVEFSHVPEIDNAPLVVDSSSNILSRPIDVEKYGVIYACCQKNIGIAGLAISIVREDLLGHHQAHTPSLLEWQHLHEKNSLPNTMPTFAWYVLLCCLQWIEQSGGVVQMQKNSIQKAKLLYEYIDNSDFYSNPVAPQYRSKMNVPFTLQKTDLDALFLQQSTQAGLTNLKGHVSVGGMRASIYNSMPEEGVHKLIEFMHTFSRQHK